MAVALVQVVRNSSGTAATSISVTGTFTAGNFLHVVAYQDQPSATATFSGGGNTYSKRTPSTGSFSQVLEHAYVLSCSGGSQTITATFASSTAVIAIAVAEFSGAGAFQVEKENDQTSPGTGANAVTSGNFTPTSQPAMVSAFVFNFGSDQTPSAGTSYTGSSIGTGWVGGGWSVNRLLHETRRITSTAAQAATATTSFNAEHQTVVVVFSEAAGGISVALTGQSATSGNGTLSVSASVALTGISLTPGRGTLSAGVSTTLSGASSSVANGSVLPSVSVAMSGAQAASSHGNIAASILKAITGISTSALGGSQLAAVLPALTGQSASTSKGTLTPSGSATSALTGILASISGGTLLPSIGVPITGRSIATSVGNLAGSVSLSIIGAVINVAGGILSAVTPATRRKFLATSLVSTDVTLSLVSSDVSRTIVEG